ncbi:MAG: hypothetical protein ACAH89_07765 [Rariglobus sp.]|nr:hypothetical protein [Rariglobus sp.]
MHTHIRNEGSGSRRERMIAGIRPAALTWAVTFLLLAFVSAIYAFGGTDGEQGGLYARITMVGFAVLSLVMFFIRRVA